MIFRFVSILAVSIDLVLGALKQSMDFTSVAGGVIAMGAIVEV